MSEPYRYKMPIQGVMRLLYEMKKRISKSNKKYTLTKFHEELGFSENEGVAFTTLKKASLLTEKNAASIGHIPKGLSTKMLTNFYSVIQNEIYIGIKDSFDASDPDSEKKAKAKAEARLASIFLEEMEYIRSHCKPNEANYCELFFSEENYQYYSNIISTEGPNHALECMIDEALAVGHMPKDSRIIPVPVENGNIENDNPFQSDGHIFLLDPVATKLYISKIDANVYTAPADDPLQKFRKDAGPAANHSSGYKELIRLSPSHCYSLSGDSHDIVEISHISEKAPMKEHIVSLFDDENEGTLFFDEKKKEFMAFLESWEHPYQPSLLWLYEISRDTRQLLFVPFEHDSLSALHSCRNLQPSVKYTLELLASSINQINDNDQNDPC